MKIYYKRKLPHITPVGYAFFITARLYGSLPYTVIKKLKDEKEEKERYYSILNNIIVFPRKENGAGMSRN